VTRIFLLAAAATALLLSSNADAVEPKQKSCRGCTNMCIKKVAQGLRNQISGCVAHCEKARGCVVGGPL